MKTILLISMLCAGCARSEPPATNYDNGLGSWLQKTNSYGAWVAQSCRIVKTKAGDFQPQWRDIRGSVTNSQWIAVFVGDSSFISLSIAQRHLREAFAAKVESMDTISEAIAQIRHALETNSPTPVAIETNAQTYTVFITFPQQKEEIWRHTNCLSVSRCSTDCTLVRYLEGGKTNDFHAWMVNVHVITNSTKLP